jgi:hypothetical protein
VAKYKPAPEVKEIAEKLIDSHHGHLREAKIKYLFRDKALKSKGKIELGKATKVSGKYNAVTGADFLIEIAEPHFWDMEHKQQVALIDHELSHCWIDLEGNRKIMPHDFEGFNGVLKRHGFWMGDLEVMGKTAKQLELPFDEEKPDLQVVVNNA